jgi:multidrug efflux pump subunit AcrA (membrane-fusion protein)
MVRWITIVLAVLGFGVAMVALTPTFPTPPDIKPERMPSVNPFTKGIASLGVIECAERESSIAPAVSGVVTDVRVKVGDRVKKGDVLLSIDDRLPRAELVRLESAIPVKQAAIDRWHALPRAEDLPPLVAVAASASAMEASARVEVASREDDLGRVEEAVKNKAKSERDVLSARFALEDARAKLAEASATVARAAADLAKAQAGGWKPDLAIAEAEMNQQKAAVEALRIELDRYTVRAPRDGTILRRDVESGELVGTGSTKTMLVLGDLSTLYVRAQVDEEDIALVRQGSKAVGRTRGVRVADMPLTIVRIEPFARGKSQLSGTNVERVDTRVVEVVLAISGTTDHPLYPGLAIDVYLEAAK